jgi:hypothetical protein
MIGGTMSRAKGGKTLELSLEDNEEFEALYTERGYKRAQLGRILLRYAMPRIDEAIKEWNAAGARRTQLRQRRPVLLRAARGGDDPPRDETT